MVDVVDISDRNDVSIQNQIENDKIEIVCKEEDWNENWEHKMHEEDLCHPNNQINQERFH